MGLDRDSTLICILSPQNPQKLPNARKTVPRLDRQWTKSQLRASYECSRHKTDVRSIGQPEPPLCFSSVAVSSFDGLMDCPPACLDTSTKTNPPGSRHQQGGPALPCYCQDFRMFRPTDLRTDQKTVIDATLPERIPLGLTLIAQFVAHPRPLN